ncbi:hypothetical protein KCU67_g7430, partial [Aureobasidium melanogenum]
MAPTSDITSSAQLSNNPKTKEDWKRNIWKHSTVAQLLNKDNTIVELKSKEKRSPEVRSVHKALLCFYSPYHDRLLNGNFSEALVPPTEPMVVSSNASILQLFFKWLYTGNIHITPPASHDDCTNKWFSGITRLYILADELNCIALQRTIMSAQVAASNKMHLSAWRHVDLLSDSSLESSGLYRYHIEVGARHWDGWIDKESPGSCSEKDDPMPPNFAYRMLMKKLEMTDDRVKNCACCCDPCKFHGHISEEEREATCGASSDTTENPEVDCEFDTEPDTESEPEDESEDTPRNESVVKKRSREDGGAAGSKTKHAKTT